MFCKSYGKAGAVRKIIQITHIYLGDLYDHLMNMRIYTLIKNKIFTRALENHEATNDHMHGLSLLIILH